MDDLTDRDQMDARAIRAVVADRIEAEGWGPAELLTWAKGKDADELFLTAVMLSRLCADPVSRGQRLHQQLHRGYGLTGHAGPELVTATQRSLGIDDGRAQRLIEHLDEAARAAAGLTGGDADLAGGD